MVKWLWCRCSPRTAKPTIIGPQLCIFHLGTEAPQPTYKGARARIMMMVIVNLIAINLIHKPTPTAAAAVTAVVAFVTHLVRSLFRRDNDYLFKSIGT